MYISGGENVYPAEVEDVLYQLTAIAEVAMIGVPDERWGEVGRAIVALKPGHALTEVDIYRHCERTWRATSIRARSDSSMRCRATQPARCTSRLCDSSLARLTP